MVFAASNGYFFEPTATVPMYWSTPPLHKKRIQRPTSSQLSHGSALSVFLYKFVPYCTRAELQLVLMKRKRTTSFLRAADGGESWGLGCAMPTRSFAASPPARPLATAAIRSSISAISAASVGARISVLREILVPVSVD